MKKYLILSLTAIVILNSNIPALANEENKNIIIDNKYSLEDYKEYLGEYSNIYNSLENLRDIIYISEEVNKAEERKIELQRRESVRFDSDDVTKISYITDYELAKVLSHHNSGKLLSRYAEYFVEAERIYKINAFFLVAVAAHESSWGKKPAGEGTNLTGIKMYTPTSRGEIYTSYKHNILDTAKLLRNNYVVPNSPRYNEEYGPSVVGININYCLYPSGEHKGKPDFNWSENITAIANDFVNIYHTNIKEKI